MSVPSGPNIMFGAKAVILMGPTAAAKPIWQWSSPRAGRSKSSAWIRRWCIAHGHRHRQTHREMLQKYPHHLVDILDPREAYSAGRFVRDACALITDIHARGRVPLLVAHYALFSRVAARYCRDAHGDNGFRTELELRATQLGWPALHAELAARDPQAAGRIGVNDAQRIQRALEVIALTAGRCRKCKPMRAGRCLM